VIGSWGSRPTLARDGLKIRPTSLSQRERGLGQAGRLPYEAAVRWHGTMGVSNTREEGSWS